MPRIVITLDEPLYFDVKGFVDLFPSRNLKYMPPKTYFPNRELIFSTKTPPQKCWFLNFREKDESGKFREIATDFSEQELRGLILKFCGDIPSEIEIVLMHIRKEEEKSSTAASPLTSELEELVIGSKSTPASFVFSAVADKVDPLVKCAGGSIFGKRVLDVGAFDGKNTAYLTELGADAFAIEPLKEPLDKAILKKRISPDRAINATLQNLPREYFGSFDCVFVSLFSVDGRGDNREKFFELLSRACKPSGIAVIGSENEELALGSSYVRPLTAYAAMFFNSVRVSVTSSSSNKYVLSCSLPKSAMGLVKMSSMEKEDREIGGEGISPK